MDRKIEKRLWTKKRVISVITITVVIGICAFVLLHSSNTMSPTIQRGDYQFAKIQNGEFQDFLQIRGNVLPIDTVYLDSPEGGQVDEVYIEEGAFVEKGQPLLRLENNELELVVRGREESLNSEINKLDEMQLNLQQQLLEQKNVMSKIDFEIASTQRLYKRRAALWKDGLISELEYINSKATYEYNIELRKLKLEVNEQANELHKNRMKKQKAIILRMKDDMELTRSRLDRLVLKSPVSGQLSFFEAEVGESKGKGQRIGMIDVLDQLKVRATTDEHYLSRLRRELIGSFDLGDSTYELKISKISPEITDGVVEFDLLFSGAVPGDLHRGQTIYIRLELGESEPALLLPRGGFFQQTGGKWIFVIDEKNEIATKRSISLGRQNNDVFEILSGLDEGEKVIISSYKNIQDVETLKLK